MDDKDKKHHRNSYPGIITNKSQSGFVKQQSVYFGYI